MTDENKINDSENLDNICEECKKEDQSVSQNLILTGYKLCSSCKISKTIFPIQVSVTELPAKFERIYNKKNKKGARTIKEDLTILL